RALIVGNLAQVDVGIKTSLCLESLKKAVEIFTPIAIADDRCSSIPNGVGCGEEAIAAIVCVGERNEFGSVGDDLAGRSLCDRLGRLSDLGRGRLLGTCLRRRLGRLLLRTSGSRNMRSLRRRLVPASELLIDVPPRAEGADCHSS